MNVKSAFTLIELLTIIALIGIMAVTILLSLAGLRSRSRDGFRRSELTKIQQYVMADEIIDGSFPDNQPAGCFEIGAPCTSLDILVAKAYLGSLPDDPKPNQDMYYYRGADGDYEYFVLYALIEQGSSEGFILPESGSDWCADNLATFGTYFCTGGYYKAR